MRPVPLLLATLAAVVITAASSGPVQAGAWCLWYDWSTYNCGFHTLQQCLITRQGENTAYCTPNAYDEAPPPRQEPRRHRRQTSSR
jgi:hypothetical protein